MVSLSIGQADDIFQTARMYASAGALSIRTVTPEFKGKSFNTQIKLKGGSFGLVNPSLRYEQKLSQQWYLTVHGDYLRADGNYPFTLINGQLTEEHKRRNSDIESWRTELNLHGDLGKGSTLSVKGYYLIRNEDCPVLLFCIMSIRVNGFGIGMLFYNFIMINVLMRFGRCEYKRNTIMHGIVTKM